MTDRLNLAIDPQERLDFCLDTMTSHGADQASVSLSLVEKHELNTEGHEVKLLRSTAEAALTLTFYTDKRKASTRINKLSDDAIIQAVSKLVQQAKSAPQDPANDIAEPCDASKNKIAFELGIQTPDLDGLYDLLAAFNADIKHHYPQINGDAILSYDHSTLYIANTKGVRLQEAIGNYNFQIMFAAKDGERITSFNFSGASLLDLKQNLMDIGLTGDMLKQTIQELDAKPLKAKFVGDVIIAPLCVQDFLKMVQGIALADHALISGTSILKDKIGEAIASPLLSWSSIPNHPELAGSYAITSDGFVAKDVSIIEKGILKNHLLSLYGAKKTNRERSGSYGATMVVEAGNTALKDLIKNVERGILLTRFSGGSPGANGEFAGVAKNSFYIENGEIQFPITETMVSGNIFDTLKHIKDISQERVNYGSELLPWIHTTGVTISG